MSNNETRFLFATTARLGCLLFIALVFVTAAFARDRGPRVEIVCPSPPTPVTLNKQQLLVYELHITNFDVVPLTLKLLDVFLDERNGEPLNSLSGDRLAAAIVRVGAPMMAEGGRPEDKLVIQPGARSVVFMWIVLPAAVPAPALLRHRVVFSSVPTGGTSAAESRLEGFPVPVKHDAILRLSPPFNGGTWVAGSGPSNDSDHRRTITAVDGSTYSAERFAIDWVKVGPNGDSRHDGATRNENWWGWGEPVLAVADGEVTEVIDGLPDNTPRVLPPVTLDSLAGNHVILQIAPNRYATYAHLQNGSIKVRLHDHVHQGDVLALLGNSGNTTGAHLHFQVTDRNSVLQAEGVPFVFGSFTYLGPGSEYELDKHVSVPWVESIPPGDAVLEFEPMKR